MRYGLVIGTNYTGAPYQLSGCENDARDWYALLDGAGYNEVRALVGESATREEILQGIGTLLAEAKRGDRLVVTYSGHGTWVPDQDGDEPDRRDEAWCPDDMQTAGLITDDDLAAVLGQAAPGVGILVLSDSCYSGTVTRFAELLPSGEYVGKRARFLPPNLVDAHETDEELGAVERAIPAVTRTYTEHASLISGCSDTEVSYDAWFGGRANGAFTRAALDAYRSGMSLAGWYRAIRDRLPSEDYGQTPQLTAQAVWRKYRPAL